MADDGRGMDDQTLEKVQDPFFTTKGFKKVGLGIPLLKATAQTCRGDFHIRSAVGRGTEVRASLQRSHLDCPPLGNLRGHPAFAAGQPGPGRSAVLLPQRPGRILHFFRDDIRPQVGDLHLSHPDVYRFLKDYIHEGLGPMLAPAP